MSLYIFQYFIHSIHFILSFHILDRPDMVNASTIRFEYLSFFTIRITWGRPNDNFNEIYNYELFALSPSIPSSAAIQPEFEFDTPEPNINYAIDIIACNEVGCGDVSEIVEFSSITTSLSVCLSICLSVCLSVHQHLVSVIIISVLHVYTSVYLSIYTSICLFITYHISYFFS